MRIRSRSLLQLLSVTLVVGLLVPLTRAQNILGKPVVADGIRVRGRPGGTDRYVTACELDGIKAP